jgi:hypothetical protein
MTEGLVKQSIAELRDLVRCRRYMVDAVQVVADRIEELEAKLAKVEHIVRILASAEWDDRLGEAVDLACAYLAEVDKE